MNPNESVEDADHRRHVGNTLMAFSTLGLVLGATMMVRGAVHESFLDGPSTLVIGAVTLVVGFSLRHADHPKR